MKQESSDRYPDQTKGVQGIRDKIDEVEIVSHPEPDN